MKEKFDAKLGLGKVRKEEFDDATLQSFFDGELDARKTARIRERLDAGDLQFAQRLEELRAMREGVRSWLYGETLDAEGNARELDLWDKLEKRLAAEPLPSKGFFHVVRESLVVSLDNLFSYVPWPAGMWFRPQAFAAVGALVVFAFYMGLLFGSNSPENQALHLAERDSLKVDLASAGASPSRTLGKQNNVPMVAMVGSPAPVGRAIEAERRKLVGNRVVQLSLSGRRSRGQRKLRFRPGIPLHLDTSQLIGESPVPGGLRTAGSDIDWIKSDRPFTILPAMDRKAPPVIWLAR